MRDNSNLISKSFQWRIIFFLICQYIGIFKPLYDSDFLARSKLSPVLGKMAEKSTSNSLAEESRLRWPDWVMFDLRRQVTLSGTWSPIWWSCPHCPNAVEAVLWWHATGSKPAWDLASRPGLSEHFSQGGKVSVIWHGFNEHQNHSKPSVHFKHSTLIRLSWFNMFDNLQKTHCVIVHNSQCCWEIPQMSLTFTGEIGWAFLQKSLKTRWAHKMVVSAVTVCKGFKMQLVSVNEKNKDCSLRTAKT